MPIASASQRLMIVMLIASDVICHPSCQGLCYLRPLTPITTLTVRRCRFCCWLLVSVVSHAQLLRRGLWLLPKLSRSFPVKVLHVYTQFAGNLYFTVNQFEYTYWRLRFLVTASVESIGMCSIELSPHDDYPNNALPDIQQLR